MSLLPAATIRAAVDTVYAGFVTGARIYPDDWDRAVTTLSAARIQYGGKPRHLIARLFLTARSDEPADIAGIVAALVDHLDTHSVTPPPSGDHYDDSETKLTGSRPGELDGHPSQGPPAEPRTSGQLRFFDL